MNLFCLLVLLLPFGVKLTLLVCATTALIWFAFNDVNVWSQSSH